MGILNAIKGQLIDVIEWTDSSSKTMVHIKTETITAAVLAALQQ